MNYVSTHTYDDQELRWTSNDPAGQFNNGYLAMGNNPVMYVDPDGEFIFAAVAVSAFVFGTTNLIVQDQNGEIDNFGDAVEAFGAGAIAGAAIATGVQLGLAVPILAPVIKGAGIAYGFTAGTGIVLGVGEGISTGDWNALGNTGKLLAGNFYLDGNRNFFGQTWQGISRFSWELVQTTAGHGFSQFRNMAGLIDRVDYFGGATFATSEYRDASLTPFNGLSLGDFININIELKVVLKSE